jgi:hypothetical protein
MEACRERTGPVRVRPKSHVRGAGSADRRRPRCQSTIGDLGQAAAKAHVTGVDRPLAAGFRIFDDQQADVRQSDLTRVEDLDGDDLASTAEPSQRRRPGVDGIDEVRDHDREPAAAQDTSERVDRTTEVDLSPEG